MAMRRCESCFCEYDEADGFHRHSERGRDASTLRSKICKHCLQTAKDEKKQRNRWRAKAESTITRHAKSLKIPKERLMTYYGWHLDLVEYRQRHNYDNTCSYCEQPYATMGHASADITLDIVDRTKEPFFKTNVTHCCMTCNRKKGLLSPSAWEGHMRYTKQWLANMKLPLEERQRGQAIQLALQLTDEEQP